MHFSLAGKKFSVTPQDVQRMMRGVEPEPVRTHGVRLGEVLFPVKQVLSKVTGLSKADFNSHQARHVLRRMGLNVVEEDGGAQ